MPDPGVHSWVEDMLERDFGIDLDELPEFWLPLGITGTMDWVFLCEWWVWEYTGVFDSDEPYKWIFRLGDAYEIDPDQLLIFRESKEANAFDERMREPGICGKERTEAVQFLIQDTYEQFEVEPPPQDFVELVLYCTLMWILSEYGRDWLSTKDPVFKHVYDYGVAYVMRWDGTMLDPDEVVCTFREPATCKYCGERLWCVLGFLIDMRWEYTCNSCVMELMDTGSKVDEADLRIRAPSCPRFGGGCLSTECPHNVHTKESIKERMQEWGSERVEEYREHVRNLGGRSPRQLAGQTAETIVNYYADIICPRCDRAIMSVKRLLEATSQKRGEYEHPVIEFDCPHCGGPVRVEQS